MPYQPKTHIDTDAVARRLHEACVYRGFTDMDHVERFLGFSPEHLAKCLKSEGPCRMLAGQFGLQQAWLLYGMGPRMTRNQEDWYEMIVAENENCKNKRPLDGLSREPNYDGWIAFRQGRSVTRIPTSRQLTGPPKYLLLPRQPKDHLSPDERKKFNAIWDPTGLTRDVLLLGEIAEGKSRYPERHRYHTTVISAARIGWCLAIDHDNGFVDADYLKDAVKELQWHREFGVVELASAKPQTPRYIIEDYEKAIATCDRLVERAAADLKIYPATLEPKTPPPNWFASWQKGPDRSP